MALRATVPLIVFLLVVLKVVLRQPLPKVTMRGVIAEANGEIPAPDAPPDTEKGNEQKKPLIKFSKLFYLSYVFLQ